MALMTPLANPKVWLRWASKSCKMPFRHRSTFFIFFFILHLNFNSQALFDIGRSSKTMQISESAEKAGASTSGPVGYWFPPSHESRVPSMLEGYKKSLHEENNPPPISFLNLFRKTSKDKLAEHTIEIYPLRKSNKFFIDQMNPKTMRCNFHPSMIQLGFQNIWEKPQVLGVEVKEWLEVLAHLLMNDPLGDAIVQDKLVSTLYGLSSLQLRYHTNPDILPHIDAVWDLVYKRIQDGRRFTLPMSMDLPWYKEILNPTKGFSEQMGKPNRLIELTNGDKEIVDALSVDFQTSSRALKKFQKSFHSYSAYKRVAVLAAFYNCLKMYPDGHTTTILNDIQPTEHSILLNHEIELIRFILSHSGRRKKNLVHNPGA
ncbi:hypothetical protein VP01_2212g1 [Puccinia sorghi]|uniref:Uncharacterized protein n=1 Tax=Puccinia sorghi TaxID=27349 RepID=A0A0L6V9G1_9BASI|nr:hypothetical protein VP01_2212g1 [Puccinia sorghi]